MVEEFFQVALIFSCVIRYLDAWVNIGSWHCEKLDTPSVWIKSDWLFRTAYHILVVGDMVRIYGIYIKLLPMDH